MNTRIQDMLSQREGRPEGTANGLAYGRLEFLRVQQLRRLLRRALRQRRARPGIPQDLQTMPGAPNLTRGGFMVKYPCRPPSSSLVRTQAFQA